MKAHTTGELTSNINLTFPYQSTALPTRFSKALDHAFGYRPISRARRHHTGMTAPPHEDDSRHTRTLPGASHCKIRSLRRPWFCSTPSECRDLSLRVLKWGGRLPARISCRMSSRQEDTYVSLERVRSCKAIWNTMPRTAHICSSQNSSPHAFRARARRRSESVAERCVALFSHGQRHVNRSTMVPLADCGKTGWVRPCATTPARRMAVAKYDSNFPRQENWSSKIGKHVPLRI